MDRVSGFDPENVSSNLTKCLFKTDVLEMSSNYHRILGCSKHTNRVFG